MAKDVYVQVGITALRSPTGAPLPEQPIYIKVPSAEIAKSGLTESEELPCRDAGGLFAAIHREYMKLLKEEESSYAT